MTVAGRHSDIPLTGKGLTLMENDLVKKLMWSSLLTVISAIPAIVARKGAERVWVHVMGEEPPVD